MLGRGFAERAADSGERLVLDPGRVFDFGVEGDGLREGERLQCFTQVHVVGQRVFTEPVTGEGCEVIDQFAAVRIRRQTEQNIGDSGAAVSRADRRDRRDRRSKIRSAVEIERQPVRADEVPAVEAAQRVADEVDLRGTGLLAYLSDAGPQLGGSPSRGLVGAQRREKDRVAAELGHHRLNALAVAKEG